MISEIEKKIGNCERVFDLAKARLEKIVIAIEEAELHGAPPQKLIFDLATATADFSAAIDELNSACLLRDSKQPPRPPAENYIELFKKNAAPKRAALASAREEEAQAAAKMAYDSAIRASAPPIPVVPRRAAPEPPPRPETCSLEDVVGELETRINRLTAEISALEAPGQPWGILGLRRSLSLSTKASDRARIELLIADRMPPYEAKMAERAQLREEHKNLLAQRSDAKKAAGKS